jgi:TfoX/Sxy family transcriptional regulator of competence genes
MAFNPELADRVRRALARRKNCEEKRMFAGIGFLINGNLLVGVRDDTLLVRVGPDQYEDALQENHVGEFNITGRGPMKGWVVVDLKGVQGDKELKDWLERALKFVKTLPPK